MSDPITAKDKGMKTNRGMKMNNPSEQRAYVRRLKKLQARDRRWGDYRTDSHRIQEINEAYDELRPAPGRKNREIDDGGLD